MGQNKESDGNNIVRLNSERTTVNLSLKVDTYTMEIYSDKQLHMNLKTNETRESENSTGCLYNLIIMRNVKQKER